MIVPYLDVSADPILVAEQYANSKIDRQRLTAYAKICGREWTYYVNDPKIIFGREPDAEQGGVPPENPEVHIDLGPAKTVSRNHAELYFDGSHDKWHVKVLGRNGVKINDAMMKSGQDRPIQSGDVISIAGTQMLFQAASGKAVIHQMFIDKMLAHQEAKTGARPRASDHHQPLPFHPDPNGGYPAHSPYAPPPPMYGQTAIAPAPIGYPPRPVTPVTTPQKAPQSSTKKRSPRQYGRGIMLESTEQINYALDSSRDLKPGCSYASMITWAILSSPEEAMSLNHIYDWIKQHYAYYRLVPSGWQVGREVPSGKTIEDIRTNSFENSIRHNLSLNAAFEKVARRADEPGKGMKWRIKDDKRDETIAAAQKNASKGGGRTSSAPGSPAGPGMSGGFPQAPPMLNGSPIKMQQQQPGLPMSSFQPVQKQEPGTPTPPQDSAPQLPAYAPTQGPFPTLSDPQSPLHQRTSARLLSGMDSSPVLNSNTYNSDYPANTPAPRAHNLPIPQANTIRLPSSHMVDSSPAPFWSYPNGYNSTPARQVPASSPVKANGVAAGLNSLMGAFQSSSPPPAANGIGAESPTRRTAVNSRPASSSKVATVALRPASRELTGNDEQRREVEEDGTIDLVKYVVSAHPPGLYCS